MIWQASPCVLGTLLHCTQTGLKRGEVDSSALCEKCRSGGKKHTHLSYQADIENYRVGAPTSFSPHFSFTLSSSIQDCPHSEGTSMPDRRAQCEASELAVT